MIAEPWDFVSGAGKNLLEGRIMQLSTSTCSHEWIICKIIPFIVGENNIQQVAIVRRYADTDSIANKLIGGESVGVNIVYEPHQGIISVERLNEALHKKRGLSFLAGSVKLVPSALSAHDSVISEY
jgi:hypothetical protein